MCLVDERAGDVRSAGLLGACMMCIKLRIPGMIMERMIYEKYLHVHLQEGVSTKTTLARCRWVTSDDGHIQPLKTAARRLRRLPSPKPDIFFGESVSQSCFTSGQVLGCCQNNSSCIHAGRSGLDLGSTQRQKASFVKVHSITWHS
jgi:hypothetical protein